MTSEAPNTDALRRKALEASWRRGSTVAQRRVWARWALWGAIRALPLLVLAALAAWGLSSWMHKDDAEAMVAGYVTDQLKPVDPLGASAPPTIPPAMATPAPSLALPPSVVAEAISGGTKPVAAEPLAPVAAPVVSAASAAASQPAAPIQAPVKAAIQLKLDLVGTRPATSRPNSAGDKSR